MFTLRWALTLRYTPKAIADGLTMGTFVTLAHSRDTAYRCYLFLAKRFSVSRTAAFIPVWITNPVTVAPIYTFNYWIRLQFCDGMPLRQIPIIFVETDKSTAKMEFSKIQEQIKFIVIFT